MSEFIAAIVTACVVYFIYTRVRKARARRDAMELGVGGRSTGAGRKVKP